MPFLKVAKDMAIAVYKADGYPDFVREAVNEALTGAQLELDDIEAIVYSLSHYADKYVMSQEDMARVVVKNRKHASLKSEKAHLREEVTVDEVMQSEVPRGMEHHLHASARRNR